MNEQQRVIPPMPEPQESRRRWTLGQIVVAFVYGVVVGSAAFWGATWAHESAGVPWLVAWSLAMAVVVALGVAVDRWDKKRR